MAPAFVPALKMPVAKARSLFWKPLRHGFDAGGKNSGFAKS